MHNKREILSKREEALLGRRAAKGDLEARNTLVERNLSLVPWYINKFVRYKGDLSLEDLEGHGYLGLIEAAKTFRPSRGKFSTHATWRIRQHISRAIKNEGRTIRVSVHVQERWARIKRFIRTFSQKHGRNPEVEEIAKGTKSTLRQTKRDLERMHSHGTTISLSQPGRGNNDVNDGWTVEDTITNESTPRPDLKVEMLDQIETLERELDWFKQLIKRCDVSLRDERAFKTFYNIDSRRTPWRKMTLEEVGQIFGVTRERIRQTNARLWRQVARRRRDINEDWLISRLRSLDELRELAKQ